MMRLLVLVALLATTSAARAGCVSSADDPNPAPYPVTVCYGGSCEVTDIAFYCANATSARIGFANGWSLYEGIDEEGKVSREVTYKGALRDAGKLTCQREGAAVDCLKS